MAICLGIATTAVLLVFNEGAISGSDGRSVYEVAVAIASRHALNVPIQWGFAGQGGLFYCKSAIGLALVVLPVVFLIQELLPHASLAPLLEQAAAAAIFAPITGLITSETYLLSRRLDQARTASAIAAVGVTFGSYLLSYSKEFSSDPLVALCLLIALERILARAHIAAAIAIGLAILTRPQTAAVLPIFAWLAWSRGRQRGVALVLVGGLAATVVDLAYNAVRWGSVLDFGYHGEHFSIAGAPAALRMFMVDPSESVWLFAPALLVVPYGAVRLWRGHRDVVITLGGNALITLALAVTWWSPTGGWSWGPRLLMPGLVPLLVMIAPALSSRRWLSSASMALLALGFLVSAPSLVVSSRAQQLDGRSVPSVLREWELLPSTIHYTLGHVFHYVAGQSVYYRSATVWEVGVARLAGPRGLVLAGLVVVLLLFAVARASWWAAELIRSSSADGSRPALAGQGSPP